MTITHADTEFADTQPAHHVIAYQGSLRPAPRVNDASLAHHIGRTTRSSMRKTRRRSGAQSVGDWAATRVIAVRRLALVTAAWLLGARP